MLTLALSLALTLPAQLPPAPDFRARGRLLAAQVDAIAPRAERWSPWIPLAVYGGLGIVDEISTEVNVRKGRSWEHDPLPWINHASARVVYTVATPVALTLLDRHLSTHGHRSWAHAMRIAVALFEGNVDCGNLGRPFSHFYIQWNWLGLGRKDPRASVVSAPGYAGRDFSGMSWDAYFAMMHPAHARVSGGRGPQIRRQ